jgi:hypothetical protein
VPALLRKAAAADPPKLADVSSAYAKALKRYRELGAEAGRLRELPRDPDILMKEFGYGDLKTLEGLRQARIAELNGDSRFGFMDGQITRARLELDRAREQASAIVRRRVASDYVTHLEAIAAGVRAVVDAMGEHDRFLAPMAADGVNLTAMTAATLPHRLVHELQDWVRGFETKR